MNKIEKIYIITDASFLFPDIKQTNEYVIKPNSIPVVIEYPNGIITITKNAGIANAIFLKSILPIFSIIETPTNINTGATAAMGTHFIKGSSISETINPIAVNTDVSSVLTPASILLLLSTYVFTLIVVNLDRHS